jgi:hypothetical protein
MSIHEQIEKIFLVENKVYFDLISVDPQFKKCIKFVQSQLMLDGYVDVDIVYYLNHSGQYHHFKIDMNLYEEDFGDLFKNRYEFLSVVADEINITLNELFNRPCGTTCESCPHEKCTRGEIIENDKIDDTIKLISISTDDVSL